MSSERLGRFGGRAIGVSLASLLSALVCLMLGYNPAQPGLAWSCGLLMLVAMAGPALVWYQSNQPVEVSDDQRHLKETHDSALHQIAVTVEHLAQRNGQAG